MTFGTATLTSEAEAVSAFLDKPGEESFRELFVAVAPRLIRYFLHRGCAYCVAEELTVDVMECAYRRLSILRDRTRFLPWLFAIARNGLARHLRKGAREIRTLTIDFAASVADDGLEPERYLRSQSGFYHWLSFLDPEEREILELRYLDELNYEEIAAALGIPLGTVKWKIHNSKKKLAAHFGRSKAR